MKYHFRAVRGLVGGFTLPDEKSELVLYDSAGLHVALVRSADSRAFQLDRRFALATLLLRGGFGEKRTAEFQKLIDAEVESIQGRRRTLLGSHLAVVIGVDGEADLSVRSPTREHEDFIVCFNATNTTAIVNSQSETVALVTSAICLEAKSECSLFDITSGVYYSDKHGSIVYSFQEQFGGIRVYMSHSALDTTATSFAARYQRMSARAALGSAFRFHSSMAGRPDERYRAFIDGWTAFEIFVNVVYAEQRKASLNSNPFPNPKRLSMTEKFAHVARSLDSDTSAPSDINLFDGFRNTRNQLVHGEMISDDALPSVDIQRLLEKYLDLYLAQKNTSSG